MREGFEAPFVRVYYNNIELTDSIEDFKYAYDEEEDDVCTLTVRTQDREAPDQKQWQEKSELKIIWGYINGVISDARKIYIQEIKWEFENETVKAMITATEKAVSMKYADNNNVYKNTNLAGIVREMGNKHGVTPFWQVTEDDIKNYDGPQFLYKTFAPLPGEETNTYLARQVKQKAQDNFDYQRTHPKEARIALNKAFQDIEKRNSDPAYRRKQKEIKLFKDGDFGSPILPKAGGAEVSPFLKFQYPTDAFKLHGNLPQAGRSDKQFIRNIASREPNGPFLVDSRDDTITIKKRNFNQKPYKTYKYGSVTGDIISFTPEGKNRAKQASSNSVAFGGWSAGNKSYFSGYSNAENDNSNPTLAFFKKKLIYYKQISAHGGGSSVDYYQKRPGYTGKTALGNFSQRNFNPRTDNTRTFLDVPDRGVPITIDNAISALQKTLKEFSNDSNDEGKSLYAPGNDPASALGNAANRRRQAELDKTKASLQVEGDPKLEVGMVITIIGVSKKYSGNYYITKADHDFGGSAGYLTSLELVRDGNNLKVDQTYASTKELGMTVNKDIGPENTPTSNTKKLKNKTNPNERTKK